MNHYTNKHLPVIFALLLTLFYSTAMPGLAIQVKASPIQQIPNFTTAPCMFELPVGAVDGEDVVCGYLVVPEEHYNPDGPTIRLAVAIIKSKDPNPRPDPLFMAQGGPGGSSIDTYASHLLSDNRLRNNRDIVLFDQRGTLYSQPALICKELDQYHQDTIEKDLSVEEDERMYIDAIIACRERLVNEGINLSAFDSLENAADIEALRQALGYEQINLYGVSYGTLLALHTMQNYSTGLRSVILDGVVPTQSNFVIESAQSMDRAFTRFFTACSSDPDCNQNYPDLENIFFDMVKQLNQTPARVPMTDPDKDITYNAVIDGDMFMSGLFLMLYSADLIPALPRMIYDARDGNFNFFARIMPIFIFDRTMSDGMYYSVICAEDADFRPEDQDLSGVRPQIAEVEKRTPGLFLEICRNWAVDQFGPEVDQPVVSNIPTLVLSGDFDPITPPANGDEAAATLDNSYVYVFPAGGHGAALDGECQDSIILSFLNDPTTPPDASCIEAISKPVFYTSKNLIEVPVIIELLNLEGNSGTEFLILVLALLLLLSAALIFPLAWFIRRLTRKAPTTYLPSDAEEAMAPAATPPPPPLLVRIAPWLASLNGLILLSFLIGLFVIVVEMVMANDNRLFFGVTAVASGWFVLPIVTTMLTLGMIIATVQSWRKRSWSIWGRIYYSSLTLFALVCTFILFKWGMLTALI